MKLLFKKNEKNEVEVYMKSEEEKNFEYLNLIDSLIKNGELDESEIEGEFLEDEIESIHSMVGFINKEVSKLNEIDEA